MDTIFGPKNVFGDVALRAIDPDRIQALGSDLSVINPHQHLGSALPLRELYRLGTSRHIHGMPKSLDGFVTSLLQVPSHSGNLAAYLAHVYHLAEDIQSGPNSVEKAVKGAVAWAEETTGFSFLGSEYGGRCKLLDYSGIEIRFDPMKRNKLEYIPNSEDIRYQYDLDSIITHAHRGAGLDLKGEKQIGFIICLAKDIVFKNKEGREARDQRNTKLAEKIYEWSKRFPILAVDIAGNEESMSFANQADRDELKNWYEIATKNNTNKTIHIGETQHTSVETFVKVIELIKPNRVGHGVQIIKAAIEGDERGLDCAKAHGVVFELCMYSNLCTGAVSNVQEFNRLVQELHSREIPFIFGTDGTCSQGFDAQTTSRRNGHQGVTLADEIVMMFLACQSEDVIRKGLQDSINHTFLRKNN